MFPTITGGFCRENFFSFRGSFGMEVDRVREGVVLFLPAGHFDHHGTDPGLVHDSIMDRPTAAPDGLLHAGLTERRGTIQPLKELPSGLKPLIDLYHQLFAGAVKITDAFELDGIMAGW